MGAYAQSAAGEHRTSTVSGARLGDIQAVRPDGCVLAAQGWQDVFRTLRRRARRRRQARDRPWRDGERERFNEQYEQSNNEGVRITRNKFREMLTEHAGTRDPSLKGIRRSRQLISEQGVPSQPILPVYPTFCPSFLRHSTTVLPVLVRRNSL